MEEKNLRSIIEGLIGIPYQHNGRDYQGVDCWGLVYLLLQELGIEVPVDDGKEIPDDWYLKEPDRYIKGLKTLGKEVGHFNNLQPLDLPYFRLYRNVITHSGVMLDNTNFIHVLIGKEVRMDTMGKRFWRSKYAGAIRLKIFEAKS